jgi:hypothetical protein
LGRGWRIVTPTTPAWTDDYSDILGAMFAKLRD